MLNVRISYSAGTKYSAMYFDILILLPCLFFFLRDCSDAYYVDELRTNISLISRVQC
jgi:hypothetical protein